MREAALAYDALARKLEKGIIATLASTASRARGGQGASVAKRSTQTLGCRPMASGSGVLAHYRSGKKSKTSGAATANKDQAVH